MKKRFRFVIALTIAVLLSGVGFALIAFWPGDSVEAVIRVDRDDPGRVKETEEDFQRYKQTQAELLTSNFVIYAALRDAEISALPTIQQQLRPVHWLRQELEVECAPDSELIYVRLSTRWRKADDCQKVLNRIVSTFQAEIVNKERLVKVDQLTKLRTRHSHLVDTVKKKADEVARLEVVFGVAELDRFKMRRLESQLDQLHEVLLELELAAIGEKAAAENDQTSILRSQIDYVRGKYATGLKELENYGGFSGDLLARRDDVKALRRDLAVTRRRIHELQIELDAPERVQVIQEAASTRAAKRLEDSF